MVGHLGWDVELLNPPDGSYPFIEWEDLSDEWQQFYLSVRADDAVRASGVIYTNIELDDLHQRVGNIQKRRPRLAKAALFQLTDDIICDWIESKKVPATAEPPEWHQQARSSTIAAAKAGPPRIGVFNTPIKAGTAMCGDKPARSGEMITGAVLEDGVMEELKAKNGMTIRTWKALYAYS